MGMRTSFLALLVALSAAACGSLAPTASSTAPETTVQTGSPTTDGPVAAPCLEGSNGFFGDGPLGSQSGDAADAATITGLAMTPYEGCEQLVVELAAASGAPATSLGTTHAELIRTNGIVRVHLDPSITGTTLSDVVFDGSLVDRVYVVRDFDDSLFFDVHLSASAVARFSEISSPARLVVDLAPGGTEIRKADHEGFIVVMPLDDTVTPPVSVEGYGRTFEGNVILRARRDGNIVAETYTTSTDYLETWGRFEIGLPTEITGNLELFIGEDSARDGVEQGIRLDVTVEG